MEPLPSIPILPVSIPTLPVTLPVTVPTTLPVTVPTTLPVTVPTTLPVTVPTTLPVTVPTTLPVTVPETFPVTVPTLPVTLPEVENPIVQQIKFYADQIKCDDFKGKGTIDDYTHLFEAASKIANDTKHVQLEIDIQGFNQFGEAADELSRLFTSFTKKIQSINIDDCMFLSAVLIALKRVVALSKAFSAFQESILEKRIHSSMGETKKILEGVTQEVECVMKHLNHFSTPTNLESANLSPVNRLAITHAINSLNNITVSMDTPDIQYINRTNQTFIQQSAQLRRTTNIIRERYSYYF